MGYHLSVIASHFNCPICTCFQQVDGSDKVVYTVKCKGCKRKLQVTPHGFNAYNITDVTDEKQTTATFLLKGELHF